MIKAVVFDCFGVLATDTWQDFLSGLPEGADIERAREAHRAFDSGKITKQKCDDEIYAATSQHFTELEDIQPGSIDKNKKLLSYIEELRRRGLKTGLLSNAASNWIRSDFLDENEQALFDDYVLSYDVGMIKPEPRMFTLATSNLGANLSEAVLVDDKEHYCKAAQTVGMKAVLYKNFSQMQRELEEILHAHI